MTSGGYFDRDLVVNLREADSGEDHQGKVFRGFKSGQDDAFCSGLEDYTYLFPDEYDAANYKLVPINQWDETHEEYVESGPNDAQTAGIIAAGILINPIVFLCLTSTSQKKVTTEHWVEFDVYKKVGGSWVKVDRVKAIVDSEVTYPERKPDTTIDNSEAAQHHDEMSDKWVSQVLDSWNDQGPHDIPNPAGVVNDHPASFSVLLYAADINPDDGITAYQLLPATADHGTGVIFGTTDTYLVPGQVYDYETLRKSLYQSNKLTGADGQPLDKNKMYELISIEPAGYPGRVADRSKGIYTVILSHRVVRAYWRPR